MIDCDIVLQHTNILSVVLRPLSHFLFNVEIEVCCNVCQANRS